MHTDRPSIRGLLAVALLCATGQALAQSLPITSFQRSLATGRGTGHASGPLKSMRCPSAAECKITVRAQLSRIDDDDVEDVPNQPRECVIRVPASVTLAPATTKLTWELSTNSRSRFEFLGPGGSSATGVVIDDDGGAFVKPPASHNGDKISFTLTPRGTSPSPTVLTGVSSYTVYLKWKKGPDSGLCAGLDPIIINRDN